MPKIAKSQRKRQVDLITIALGNPAPDPLNLQRIVALIQLGADFRDTRNTFMLRKVGQTPGQESVNFFRTKPLRTAKHPAAQQGPVIFETRCLGLEARTKFIVARQCNPLPLRRSAFNGRKHGEKFFFIIHTGIKRHRSAISGEQQSGPVITVKKSKRPKRANLVHHKTAPGPTRPYLRLNKNSNT